MKFYFSSNQFEQLQDFNFAEKQQIIELANNKMPAPAKVTLNILKLLILIPPFLLLARVDSWMFVLPLLLVLVCYFVILRPVSLMFLGKYIDEAVAQFKRRQQLQDD
ncbi:MULTISPECIES: DUF6170 family protein [unclassified Thalassotalea]|uniref:DUF6170 family protein n=1 Tax=unclassified Thalassotalea TaxID=2614972 RepID=UPI001080A433|nr:MULTISPECIES: DUF6170 family protein [unclassified Thalassotalea]NMP14816.1 hypothetical protein [Thalassotalea sp. Y01]QBY03383.1 hypothetical protein E2K93_02895 [Thalassotalea sp. HSM 43]